MPACGIHAHDYTGVPNSFYFFLGGGGGGGGGGRHVAKVAQPAHVGHEAAKI